MYTWRGLSTVDAEAHFRLAHRTLLAGPAVARARTLLAEMVTGRHGRISESTPLLVTPVILDRVLGAR